MGIWLPIYECASCGGEVFGNNTICSYCQRAIEEDRRCPIHNIPLNPVGICGDCYNAVAEMSRKDMAK